MRQKACLHWHTCGTHLPHNLSIDTMVSVAFLPSHLDLAGPVPHAVSVAAVSAPYLVGSVAFTLGGWAGMITA